MSNEEKWSGDSGLSISDVVMYPVLLEFRYQDGKNRVNCRERLKLKSDVKKQEKQEMDGERCD